MLRVKIELYYNNGIIITKIKKKKRKKVEKKIKCVLKIFFPCPISTSRIRNDKTDKENLKAENRGIGKRRNKEKTSDNRDMKREAKRQRKQNNYWVILDIL